MVDSCCCSDGPYDHHHREERVDGLQVRHCSGRYGEADNGSDEGDDIRFLLHGNKICSPVRRWVSGVDVRAVFYRAAMFMGYATMNAL